MEESKGMVDASDSGGNDPHGETSRGNFAQAITQFCAVMMMTKTGMR